MLCYQEKGRRGNGEWWRNFFHLSDVSSLSKLNSVEFFFVFLLSKQLQVFFRDQLNTKLKITKIWAFFCFVRRVSFHGLKVFSGNLLNANCFCFYFIYFFFSSSPSFSFSYFFLFSFCFCFCLCFFLFIFCFFLQH